MNTNDLLKNREDFLRRPEQGIGNTQMSHIVGEHTDTRERKEQRRGDCTGNSSKKKRDEIQRSNDLEDHGEELTTARLERRSPLSLFEGHARFKGHLRRDVPMRQRA